MTLRYSESSVRNIRYGHLLNQESLLFCSDKLDKLRECSRRSFYLGAEEEHVGCIMLKTVYWGTLANSTQRERQWELIILDWMF